MKQLLLTTALLSFIISFSQPEYDYAENFQNGVARFIKNNKTGLMDSKGNILLPAEYQLMETHEKFGFLISKEAANRQYGYYSIVAKKLIEPNYPEVQLSGSHVIFRRTDSSFVYDDKLNLIRKFSGKLSFSKAAEGLMMVNTPDYPSLYGYADATFTIVIPAQYTKAQNFSNGYALVEKGNADGSKKILLINKAGKAVKTFSGEPENIHYTNGYIVKGDIYSSPEKCTIENLKGDIFTVEKFPFSLTYYNTFFATQKSNKQKVILARNKVTNVNQYESVELAGKVEGVDYYIVRKAKACAVIDENGKIVMPFGKSEITGLSERKNMVFLSSGGKTGALNKNLTQLIPPEYDAIYYYDSLLILRKGTSYSVFEIAGKKFIIKDSAKPISYATKNFLITEEKYLTDLTGKVLYENKWLFGSTSLQIAEHQKYIHVYDYKSHGNYFINRSTFKEITLAQENGMIYAGNYGKVDENRLILKGVFGKTNEIRFVLFNIEKNSFVTIPLPNAKDYYSGCEKGVWGFRKMEYGRLELVYDPDKNKVYPVIW